MRIGKGFGFEAAHRLQHHGGKCRKLHGHSYKVHVAIESPLGLMEVGPSEGMVLDFGELNTWWKPLEAVLDHTTILEESDELVEVLQPFTPVTTFPFPPTAENLADWIREDLQKWLAQRWPNGFVTPTVRVYESEKSWAEA